MPPRGRTGSRVYHVFNLCVRSSLCCQTCERDILKTKTDFDADWYKWSTAQGHETVSIGGHKVKGQVHTRLKIYQELSDEF